VTARRDAARRLGALAAAAAGGACVEITTAEQGVLSIRFDPLPPSIVAGDTLRDSLGRVQRLRAVAFDAAGDSVAGRRSPSGSCRWGATPRPAPARR
jgi:hypothetical protein